MKFLNAEYISAVLFFISFYGLITGNNIVKSIISIGLLEISVIVFLLGVGFRDNDAPPIGQNLTAVSDPLPQALVITAIIIGVAVTAVNLTMFISLVRQNKSTAWDDIKTE